MSLVESAPPVLSEGRRVLRLTLLAPDVVEAIRDGRQPSQLTLAVLMGMLPSVWPEQKQALLLR